MPTTFAPTQKRGAALARLILNQIEAEEAKRERLALPAEKPNDKTNVLMQRVWGQISLTDLPPGAEISLVDPELLKQSTPWRAQGRGKNYAVTVSNGLSCGSAMCFAGHVTHAVGDTMIVRVTEDWCDVFGDRKSWNAKLFYKRFLKKVWRHTTSADLTYTSDFVLAKDWDDNQRVLTIQKRAKDLLGLTDKEASEFFSAHNTLDQLRMYTERLEAGKNIVTGRRMKRRPIVD